MTFRKSYFFILGLVPLFLGLCFNDAFGWTNCTQAPEPGRFCKTAGTKPPCREGCYCPGGNTTAIGTSINVKNACKNRLHESDLQDASIYLCPQGYTSIEPEDDQYPGASSINQCYKLCDANSFVFYDEITCYDGYYLKKGNNHACSSCEKGYYCTEKENLNPSCTEDQGNIYQCGVGEGKELEYAPAGASACSTCDVDGKVVVKNGELHVGCEACDAGKYTLDHQNCLDCSIGYFCQGGIQNKCTGNTYSDVQGLAECKVCSGDKMGVKYTTTTVNDQTETLQTGCGICPNGKYGNDGVCEPCPAGYRCLNGEKIICAKGYYSAAGAASCTHCPNFFTTEGPGTAWTPGANVPCTVAQIYLKDANTSGNGIMFPACLNRGDINERVLYSN